MQGRARDWQSRLENLSNRRKTGVMKTALITHEACLRHVLQERHPESVARLRTVLGVLEAEEFALLIREQAPTATLEQLAGVHPHTFVHEILDMVPDSGFAFIDGDTPICPDSGEAALRAAGAVVRGVDMVMAGEAQNVFCAIRPPGHHAESRRAMGFCLFNNVAVGAEWAREHWGLKRVAVIDFDVHHGNGTQEIFARDAGLFYGSTHQDNFYPGTGSVRETGVAGNIVNAPLPAGADGALFQEAMSERVLPALDTFQPELIFISAGFDAHAGDPLAGLCLREEDFVWATRQIMEIAHDHCNDRVVSTLEGGYDLHALGASVRAHVRTLMGV